MSSVRRVFFFTLYLVKLVFKKCFTLFIQGNYKIIKHVQVIFRPRWTSETLSKIGFKMNQSILRLHDISKHFNSIGGRGRSTYLTTDFCFCIVKPIQ